MNAVEYVQGVKNEPPQELNEWQRNCLEEAKKRGLRVQTLAIEPSNMTGRVGDDIEFARIFGENIAVDRFTDIAFDGAVALMDADTLPGRDATQQIIDLLVDRPDVGMLKIALDYSPGEGGGELYRSAYAEKFFRYYGQIQTLIRTTGASLWYAVRASALGRREPGLASAPLRDTLRPKQGKTVKTGSVRLYTQDRARLEGGQFGENRYQSIVSNSQLDFLPDHPLTNIFLYLYTNVEQDAERRQKIANIFEYEFDFGKNYPELVKKLRAGEDVFLDLYRIKQAQGKISPGDYVSIVYQMINELTTPSQVSFQEIVSKRTAKERHKHEERKRLAEQVVLQLYQHRGHITVDDLSDLNLDLSLANFLKINPWMLDEVNELKGTKSFPSAMKELAETYPDFFLEFDQTEYAYPSARLRGIIEFLGKVHEQPEKFADISPYLQ